MVLMLAMMRVQVMIGLSHPLSQGQGLQGAGVVLEELQLEVVGVVGAGPFHNLQLTKMLTGVQLFGNQF